MCVYIHIHRYICVLKLHIEGVNYIVENIETK